MTAFPVRCAAFPPWPGPGLAASPLGLFPPPAYPHSLLSYLDKQHVLLPVCVIPFLPSGLPM